MFSAADILNHLASYYSKIVTYSDSGCALIPDVKFNPSITKFSTKYKCPDLFKFEFIYALPHVDFPRTYIYSSVIFDGNECYYLEIEKGEQLTVEKIEKFTTAISMATGVSSGSIHTISNLLMPTLTTGFRLNGMLYTSVSSSKSSNNEHYEISGKGPYDEDWRVLIDVNTNLLLKKGRRQENSNLWTEQNFNNIKVNNHIDEEIFSLEFCRKEALTKVNNWETFEKN